MKLVFFIPSLGRGGAERVTATWANYWADKGWQALVVTLAPGSADCYHLHPGVVRVALDHSAETKHLLGALVNNVRRIQALRRVLTREKPDAVVAMMSTCNVILALAAFGLTGMVRIGSERTHPPQVPLGAAWEWLRARSYRLLDALVVLTTEGRDWVRANTSAKRIRVIPNPVVWPLDGHEPRIDPQATGLPGRKRLLAVGRLGEEKGFDSLIAIFSELAPAYPDWELAIVGDGPERGHLQDKTISLGLNGVVLLPGEAGNIGEWYASADLYVLSSRFEGFPNALLEAMAYGLPAVSFDCDTGPRDIIRNEWNGLLVPAGDRKALAQALSRLMGDPRLREELGSRATEVRERFAITRLDTMWASVFREAAGIAAGSAP